MTVLFFLAAVHVIALAGVLLLSRRDAVLVDDAGQPLMVGPWRHHLVPATEAPLPVAEAEKQTV